MGRRLLRRREPTTRCDDGTPRMRARVSRTHTAASTTSRGTRRWKREAHPHTLRQHKHSRPDGDGRCIRRRRPETGGGPVRCARQNDDDDKGTLVPYISRGKGIPSRRAPADDGPSECYDEVVQRRRRAQPLSSRRRRGVRARIRSIGQLSSSGGPQK